MRVKAVIVGAMSIVLLSGIASGQRDLMMKCRVNIPKRYRKAVLNPPPNGEPEPLRYKTAYEAFWWNCVAVRAENLTDRCPFLASGTPAASAGARDGALDAESQLQRLRQKHPASAVQRYLRSMAATPLAAEKMRPYFNKPTSHLVK